jgi:hypothetical protein
MATGKQLKAAMLDSVEKHEPASDVATVVVDSLKALDPNRPIREADSCTATKNCLYSKRGPPWSWRVCRNPLWVNRVVWSNSLKCPVSPR